MLLRVKTNLWKKRLHFLQKFQNYYNYILYYIVWENKKIYEHLNCFQYLLSDGILKDIFLIIELLYIWKIKNHILIIHDHFDSIILTIEYPGSLNQ